MSKIALTAILLSVMLLSVFAATPLDKVSALEFGPYEITTYASVSASPNPAAMGQDVSITMQISPPPPLGPYNATNILKNYTLEITKPDGTRETETVMEADAEGHAVFLYVPTMAGNYNIVFRFPEQNVTVRAATVPGYDMFQREDIMLESSNTTTLTIYDSQLTSQLSETPTSTATPTSAQSALSTPSSEPTQNPNISPQLGVEGVPLEEFYIVLTALVAVIVVLVVIVSVLLRKILKTPS